MSHEVVDVVEQPVIVVEVAEAVGARGPKGDPGRDGLDGAPGVDGKDGADGAPGRDGLPGADGRDGVDGQSAYELAVAAGFVGTEVEWLASLVGPAGADGADGRDGVDGAPGPAGERGPEGPQGPAGDPGPQGDVGPAGEPGPQGERGLPGADGAQGPKGDTGPKGDKGDPGTPGADGADGAPGPGLPAGGTAGQVPVKASTADYDIVWGDPTGGGTGELSDAGVAALVDDEASSTGQALRSSFVASETVRRVVTSTDPEHPVAPGDLLVVLPAPRVVATSWSEQTYGDAGSVTSIAATIPLDVQAGDLLVAMVSSRKDVASAAPSGWTAAATAEGPGTIVSPTGMLRVRAYTKAATGSEGGATATFTQGSAGRMSLVVLVVRSGSGAILVEDAATTSYAAGVITNPGLHPMPSLTATGRGRLALHAGQCALAQVGPDEVTTIAVPEPWFLLTPSSTPVNTTPTHASLRMWVAVRAIADGGDTGGIAAHGAGSHDGGSLTLVLAAA